MMDDLIEEMVNPAPAQADKARRRRLWATVTIVGLAALGVTSLTTSALFTDQEQTNDAISTGSVNLEVGQLSFSVPVDNMLPGASVVAPITVTNNGSLRYQYAISYRADDRAGDTADLSSALRVSLHATSTCTLAQTATATDRIGQSGAPGTFGLATSDTPIVGTPGVDEAPGNRHLNATASEELCVRIDFDEAAGNSFQDTSTTLELTFDARQITFDPSDPDESGA